MLGMMMRKMVWMMLEMQVREKRKEKPVVAWKAAVKSAMSPVPKKRFRAEAVSQKEAARPRVGKAIKQEVKEENFYDGAGVEADIRGQDAFSEKDAARARARVGKVIKQEVKEEHLYDGGVAQAHFGGHDEADIAETQLKVEVKHESESDGEADAQDLEGHFAEAV